jgi:hypothetical protein
MRERDKFNTAWRNWYRKNADRKMSWQRRRRKEHQQWWREFKATKSCEVCGESAPECLEFHHRDPAEKAFTIADVAASYSKERVLAEVAKCDVLCANCHAKRHWEDE